MLEAKDGGMTDENIYVYGYYTVLRPKTRRNFIS